MPLVQRHRDLLDAYTADRFDTMCERYTIASGSGRCGTGALSAPRYNPGAMLAPSAQTWRLLSAAPPREVFAIMEQMIGTPPYRYEVVGESEARIVEHRRRGLFGQWGRPRVRIRWVRCRAVTVTEGTWVEVEASSGGGMISKAMGKADRGPTTRALQVIRFAHRRCGRLANRLPGPAHPARAR